MSSADAASVTRRSYHLPECRLNRVVGRLKRLSQSCSQRGIPFSYSLDRSYVATGHYDEGSQEFQCRVRIVEIEDGIDLGTLRIASQTAAKTPYAAPPFEEDDFPETDGDGRAEPQPVPECVDCGKSGVSLFIVEDEASGERCHMCARCLANEIGVSMTMARDYAELRLLLETLSGSRGIDAVPLSRRVLPTDLFIACCTVEILEFGYQNGHASHYDVTWRNADHLANQLVGNFVDANPLDGLPRQYAPQYWDRVTSPERLDESLAEARQAIAWMLEQPADTKWVKAVQDRLRRSTRDNFIERRDEGVVASFVKAWLQHCRMQKLQELAKEARVRTGNLADETVGVPGERVTVPIAHAVELDKWIAPSGSFMRVIVALVTESGQILSWHTSPNPIFGSVQNPIANTVGKIIAFAPNDLHLTATVVRHERYEDAMQTIVTRGVLCLSPRNEEDKTDVAY